MIKFRQRTLSVTQLPKYVQLLQGTLGKAKLKLDYYLHFTQASTCPNMRLWCLKHTVHGQLHRGRLGKGHPCTTESPGPTCFALPAWCPQKSAGSPEAYLKEWKLCWKRKKRKMASQIRAHVKLELQYHVTQNIYLSVSIVTWSVAESPQQ